MSEADDKLVDKIIDNLGKIYVNVGVPLIFISTIVGFGSSLIGELQSKKPNQPLTTFVNITGSTFIGLMSGLFWPIAMPLLGLGAIYNKTIRSN